MIGAVVRKELREARRDGRVWLVAGMIALLVPVGLLAAWSSHREARRQASHADRDDQAAFLHQGERPPHAAAHFGRMAYKPRPSLAVFDPGQAPFLGQVIWLEAHTRNPAMFRPAEDAPELRRLSDLSVAGVLTLLVPLLVFVIGHGSFAGERETGTLRQLMSTGVPMTALFTGKLVVAAGVGVATSLVAIALSVAAALSTAGDEPAGEILVRGAMLAAGYGCYATACAAVALLVSARARTARSSLLVLLSVWAGGFIVLPRVAATAAEQLHPIPASGVFWAKVADELRAARPPRDSEAYRAVARQVVIRAVGHEVTDAEAAAAQLDRVGLALQVSEELGARAHADAFEALDEAHGDQRRVRRLLSVLSPAIALRHLSSALAGADLVAHRHFAEEAERGRQGMVRAMNEDLLRLGAGRGFDYRAEADLWATIPALAHRTPTASLSLRSAAPDLIALALWTLAALWLARRAARRQAVSGSPA